MQRREVLARRHAAHLAEVATEVALVGEAGLVRDLRRAHAASEQRARFLDAHVDLVAVRREAEGLREGAHQVVAAHRSHGSERIQGKRLRIVRMVDRTRNALVDVFRITPTPLAEGLTILADALPELTPKQGVGEMKRKQFWADIVGSPLSPEGLFEIFRANFNELTPMHMPVGVEPGSQAAIEQGATLTMALPARGTVQVRVEEINERRMTLCTLEGHALAGAVRFLTEQRGGAVRFQIEVYDRPASVVDWVMMHPIGDSVQSRTWEETVERVVNASGGIAVDGVQKEETVLDPQKAGEIEDWVDFLVADRKRAEREGASVPSHEARA